MHTFFRDLRYGLRTMLKSPGFTAVAIITLALGVGANTAIFSVVDAVLLRPLPFQDPGRIVAIRTTDRGRQNYGGEASYPAFLDWRAQSHSFQAMSVWNADHFTLTGKEEAANLSGATVSANLFSLLGVSPILGRGFAPDEDQLSANGVPVVLSHQLWQSRFGSDPQVIGRTITLDNYSYTIIGVMPAGFQFPVQSDPVELWTTIASDLHGQTPMPTQRGVSYLNVIARLKPGVALTQAEADLGTIQAGLNKQYPENRPKGISIVSEMDAVVGGMRTALLVLFGAVGFVLLIACANVANLSLARATARQKEITIRSALGASRWHIVRQLLTESLLLAGLGASLGLVLAMWAINALVRMAPQGLARTTEIGLDLRVLGFTLLLAAVTGVLFGLVPALQTSRSDLTRSLNEGGRGGSDSTHRSRVRSALVVSEVALALVLLIGAGLLLQSLWRLRRVNPGFAADHVVTFALSLPGQRYPDSRRLQFFQQLLDQIRALPGVRSAGAVFGLPLDPGAGIQTSVAIEGRPVPKNQYPVAGMRPITSDYFHTMGIPLLAGRDFTALDDAKSTPVVIISQTMARRLFPGEDPIGHRIQPNASFAGQADAPMREIVGVVGDVRYGALGSAAGFETYVPHAQALINYMTVVVRTQSRPEDLVPALRTQVRALDKDLPLLGVKTLEGYVGDSVATPRFDTVLLGIFAGLAFLLTAIGLYGVVSYSVAQRTREVGIRIALGAQRGSILRMVVQQGIMLSLLGVGLGLAGALALTRLLAGMLYDIRATDPVTFAAVAILLMGITLLASYLPARRATHVDPMVALRCE